MVVLVDSLNSSSCAGSQLHAVREAYWRRHWGSASCICDSQVCELSGVKPRILLMGGNFSINSIYFLPKGGVLVDFIFFKLKGAKVTN